MARHRVPPEVSRQREVTAWDLVTRGVSQAAIAKALGVTPSAVSQILDRVETRVLKDLEKKVQRQKARQHSRLEHIYSEAMAAWDESKKPKKKSRSEKLVAGGLTAQQLATAPDGRPLIGGPTTLREKTTNEAATGEGNFLFLQTALGALSDQRKLWGLDAPKKVDVLDQRRPLEKLSYEELQARAREADALLAAENGD